MSLGIFGLTLPRVFDSQTRAIGGLLLLEKKDQRQIVRIFEEDDGAAPLGSKFFNVS